MLRAHMANPQQRIASLTVGAPITEAPKCSPSPNGVDEFNSLEWQKQSELKSISILEYFLFSFAETDSAVKPTAQNFAGNLNWYPPDG